MNAFLVTGGAGFIGSHFVRALMKRHKDAQVHVLDALTYAGDLDNLPPEVLASPRFRFSYGNVCDADLVSEIMRQVDTVVHFAAESHVARSISSNTVFFQTDVMGTQVIANSVLRNRRQIKRFLHISTSEVYGTALARPMSEEHPLNPNSPYASAKCGADRLVYSYWRTYGIPATIIRPFNQYGPNQHLEKVLPRFITSVLDGQCLTVHGDGAAARDWLYVGDTCRALLAALEAPLDAVVGEVINLGSGIATSVLTLAQTVADQMGASHDLIQHVDNRPGQVDLHISSTDKSRRLLGWSPTTALDAGIARTIEWYRANDAWWRRRVWLRHVPITLPSGELVLH